MMESDLWIVIGGRWSDLHTLGVFDIDEELPRILDLQPDSARLRRGCSNAIVLQDLVLDLVASEVEENRRSVLAYQEYIPEVGTSRDRDDSNINPPVTLSEIVGGLRHLIGESDTLIADTGEPWFISQQIKLPPAATCQLQMVYASLGWALPAGLGCQLARPKGRVILLIGDGAFQMTGHEISSMIRQKVNPIIFVFNNLGYRTEVSCHKLLRPDSMQDRVAAD
jgi:pyruvate decarboxylase